MIAPHYSPIADDLPPLYRTDEASYDQIASYLGLVDELNRGYLARLEQLTAWLSPDGMTMWPPGLAVTAGADALLDAHVALFDELASWFAYRFPGSWIDEHGDLDHKRRFLMTAARLWRCRLTPRGFLRWVCLAFGIAEDRRPILLEHFKYGPPTSDDGEVGAAPGLRATLLVPTTEQFEDFARRRELVEFVDESAPAHVHMRVCWVAPDFEPPRPASTSPSDLDDHEAIMRDLLCSHVDFVPHGTAIGVHPCGDQGEPKDHLGIAKLPTQPPVLPTCTEEGP